MTAEPSYKDEARVGQKGTHAYVWAPVGSRPLMVRDNRHDNAPIFGAICPARGGGAAMITPASDTECRNLHLAEISTQVSPGATALMICDGAGWHQTGDNLEQVVSDNQRYSYWLRYAGLGRRPSSPKPRSGARRARLDGRRPTPDTGKPMLPEGECSKTPEAF